MNEWMNESIGGLQSGFDKNESYNFVIRTRNESFVSLRTRNES